MMVTMGKTLTVTTCITSDGAIIDVIGTQAEVWEYIRNNHDEYIKLSVFTEKHGRTALIYLNEPRRIVMIGTDKQVTEPTIVLDGENLNIPSQAGNDTHHVTLKAS